MAKQFRVLKGASSQRRSLRLRLQRLARAIHQQPASIQQLPSPPSSQSVTGEQLSSRKRRLDKSIESDHETEHASKRQQISRSSVSASSPIAVWAATTYWPKGGELGSSKMPRAVPTTDKGGSSKGSSSTHYTTKHRQLQENGVYFRWNNDVNQASKELCTSLRGGDRCPTFLPGYPADKVDDVLDRVQLRTEPRLQRDVTPWVVPSPEHLFLSGELAHEYIGEEVQTLWDRCEVMGSTVPKPDVTVGLLRCAFNDEQWAKLENCATSSASFLTTPNLWFPFLICEAKTGRSGMENAETQNVHSASIAIRSILRVFIAAYGRDHENVKNLMDDILVFTVSHDNQVVTIWGHYAVAKRRNVAKGADLIHTACAPSADDTSTANAATREDFEYRRHAAALHHFRMFEGAERYAAYNFVRNLYDNFAPRHLKRLQDAIAALPAPQPRIGVSSDASGLSLVEGSQLNGSEVETGDSELKTPSETAALMQVKELTKQLQEQGKNYAKQIQDMRRESKEREMKLERENKEREMKLEHEKAQIEQERREREAGMAQQLAKLTEMISDLSKPQNKSSVPTQ